MLVNSIFSLPTMFSTLSETEFIILAAFNFSSANALNLVQSKTLSFSTELRMNLLAASTASIRWRSDYLYIPHLIYLGILKNLSWNSCICSHSPASDLLTASSDISVDLLSFWDKGCGWLAGNEAIRGVAIILSTNRKTRFDSREGHNCATSPRVKTWRMINSSSKAVARNKTRAP